MRVLVTGAFGRAGKRVVQELLAHGHQVRGLDRMPLPEELRNTEMEPVFADVADPLAMLTAAYGCDGLIHLAAYTNPYGVTSAELLRVNVIGTQNALDAAVAAGMPRVVLISSIGALGFSFPTHPCLPDYLPVDAAHPRRPQDVYGLSKLINEEAAAAATRLHGLATLVLRPPAIWDLARAHERGWMTSERMREDPSRGQKDLWAYIDTHDFAVACRKAIESSVTGHHIFFTMAEDVSSDLTPAELAERFLPQLVEDAWRLVRPCFYDTQPARDLLGFIAERSWRKILEES
jgi:nucleoside-diphosphate-sugar epimerase